MKKTWIKPQKKKKKNLGRINKVTIIFRLNVIDQYHKIQERIMSKSSISTVSNNLLDFVREN